VKAWDPSTGKVATIASHAGSGSVTVKLELGPYETRLLTVQ
jgi:hypothetical protein